MNRGFQLPEGCSNLGDKILLISKLGDSLGKVTLYDASRIANEQEAELYRIQSQSPIPVFRVVEVFKLKSGGQAEG